MVPKTARNYNIRFSQKIGTYASGDWNLQLNYNFKNRFNAAYSYKKGASFRKYAEEKETKKGLKNKIENHNLNFVYTFKGTNTGKTDNTLSLLYLKTKSAYSISLYLFLI